MGIGEFFEFEKTGRFDPETKHLDDLPTVEEYEASRLPSKEEKRIAELEKAMQEFVEDYYEIHNPERDQTLRTTRKEILCERSAGYFKQLLETK